MKSEVAYGGAIHKRPEILWSLQEVTKSIGLEEEWGKSTDPYIMVYKAKLDQFNWCSFYRTEYESKEDIDRIKLKKTLIRSALNVIRNDFNGERPPEIIAYMNN